MADPLSVAGLAISVAQVCGSLVSKIAKFTREVQIVDDELQSFMSQVESLGAVVHTISISVQPGSQLSLISGQMPQIWQALILALENLNRCLVKLSSKVSKVVETGGARNDKDKLMDDASFATRVIRTLALQLRKGELEENRAALQVHLLAVNTAVGLLQLQITALATTSQQQTSTTDWQEDIAISRLRHEVRDLEELSVNHHLADDEHARWDHGYAVLCAVASQIIDEASEKSGSRSELPEVEALHLASETPTMQPVRIDRHESSRRNTRIQRNELVSSYWELIAVVRFVIILGDFGLLCYLASIPKDAEADINIYTNLDYGSFASSAVMFIAVGTFFVFLVAWKYAGNFEWHLVGNVFRQPRLCSIWDLYFL